MTCELNESIQNQSTKSGETTPTHSLVHIYLLLFNATGVIIIALYAAIRCVIVTGFSEYKL